MNNNLKILVLGAGSWGTIIANLIAKNIKDDIYLWLRSDEICNEINNKKTNRKYTGDLILQKNIYANTNLEQIYLKSSIILFAIPHPYIIDIINELHKINHKPFLSIILSKGLITIANKPYLISTYIKSMLNTNVAVLSGPNVSKFIGNEEPCGTTIGLDNYNENIIELLYDIFHNEYFKINIIHCITCIELFSCIKNVIAFGSGMIDGLGYNSNTKASFILRGVNEMIKFIKYYYPEKNPNKIFFEDCGLADTISTCYGGRNRLCGEKFISLKLPIDKLEKEVLNGQKLQGPLTCKEIYDILSNRKVINEFIFFKTIYEIIYLNHDPKSIIKII